MAGVLAAEQYGHEYAVCTGTASARPSMSTWASSKTQILYSPAEGASLKIAYLMNTYPITSTTFIRREIESLESLNLEVKRYAVRNWDDQLVDPLDIAEQKRTHYLLTKNIRGLLAAFFLVLVSHPAGFLRALRMWLQVCKNAGGISVKHIAYFLQATYFYRATQLEGIAHVHSHFSTNATTVAMLAHAMGGSSYSFTAHGPDEFVDPSLLSIALKIKHAKFVVAISNYCRVQLIRFSSYEYFDKIKIIHCGLKLEDFSPDYFFDEANENLVCVGRLCPQKGQLLIPEAIAILKDEFPNLKVHFVGDGESRAALQAAIEKYGVSRHVEMHGWKSNADVRLMIGKSRAFLLPSFAEGLPVVIMEAFALGRPVISTFIAGIPELVDNTCGWIIPAGSVDDIAIAMRGALKASPQQLADFGREGRTRVEFEHNLKKIAVQLHDQFSEVAEAV
jgi:colanic acid/amylovoran biosynthesis glycosyltransferase